MTMKPKETHRNPGSGSPGNSMKASQTTEKSSSVRREYLTPAQLEKLLITAAQIDQEVLVGLAIQSFAGFRTGELLKLRWEDFTNEYIVVAETCSMRRLCRTVKIEDNLAQWLKPFRRAKGQVISLSPDSWRRKIARIMAKAGLTPRLHGSLRGNYAGYHFSRNGNFAETATSFGRQSLMIYQRLLKPITNPKAVKAYWAIVPEGGIVKG
jgi:integrase